MFYKQIFTKAHDVLFFPSSEQTIEYNRSLVGVTSKRQPKRRCHNAHTIFVDEEPKAITMKISVDGGSFKVAIETEYEGLVAESTAVFQETLQQAKSNDKAILRFLQIILEHRDNDDAIGYAVMGLLGWYNEVIDPVSDQDIELNLPKIVPHLINPAGDLTATSQDESKTFKH